MCNPKAEATMVYGRVGAWPLEKSFPSEFIQKFPPYEVRSNHCLECGKSLSKYEMYPPGKMPRYMCEYCYNRILDDGPHQYCLTCGGPLPYQQVEAQRQNRRELKNAYHQGVCWEYHAALAGIVLGIPFKSNQVPMLPEYVNNNQVPFSQFPQFSRQIKDFIDVRPLEPKRHLKVMKLLE